MLGYLRKPTGYQRVCDFDGDGHNRVIGANQSAYEIRDGEARGLYHGSNCYQAALSKYSALKQQLGVTSEVEYE